jgi:MraZ protein
MFSGEYEYKIDSKGRVPIPPKLRSQFADGIVLNRGIDNCIDVYPQSTWQETVAKLQTLSATMNEKSRRLNRILFANAFTTELDEQGRVMLPPALRQHANIQDTLVIAGVNNRLEIWSKESWDAEQALMKEQAWQIFESMEPAK